MTEPTLDEGTSALSAAAVRLGAELQGVLARFAVDHDALIREAAQVPAEVKSLNYVVVCSFLGHCLELLRTAQGTDAVETLVFTILERLEQAAVCTTREAML